MKQYSLFLILFSIFFMSCNEGKKNPEVVTVETTKAPEIYTSAALDADFKDENLAKVYEAYNKLKTALVNTDQAQAATEAASLLEAFSNVDADENAVKSAEFIKETYDIEKQRVAFVTVTKSMETLLEGALESGVIYKQFCPMAFNNTGAYWLSNTKEIANPYFGDKMLRCGRVDAEIK